DRGEGALCPGGPWSKAAARTGGRDANVMNAQFRIGVAVAVLVWSGMSSSALAETRYGPGVSDTEIRIGNTMPYSGPASIDGTLGHAEAAYFRMINDRGGIKGRKITFISLNDA